MATSPPPTLHTPTVEEVEEEWSVVEKNDEFSHTNPHLTMNQPSQDDSDYDEVEEEEHRILEQLKLDRKSASHFTHVLLQVNQE